MAGGGTGSSWKPSAPCPDGSGEWGVRRPAFRSGGSCSSRIARGCSGRGGRGDGSPPLPSAPASNPPEHPGNTKNLWGCFLSFSRRRKLAERSEASGQVSEFNVTCKGEAGSWAGLGGLGWCCPPRATVRAGTAPSPGSATPVCRCWGKAGPVGTAAAHSSQIHAGWCEEGAGQSEAEGGSGAATEQRGGQEGECREPRGSKLSPQDPRAPP